MKLLKVDTEHGFKLESKLKGETVGTYNIPFDKSGDISHTYISSKIPNRHLPRNLIYVAVNEIQYISTQENREIKHDEYLVTDDSKKLSSIFEDLEYKKTEHPTCLVLSRIYNPGRHEISHPL